LWGKNGQDEKKHSRRGAWSETPYKKEILLGGNRLLVRFKTTPEDSESTTLTRRGRTATKDHKSSGQGLRDGLENWQRG